MVAYIRSWARRQTVAARFTLPEVVLGLLFRGAATSDVLLMGQAGVAFYHGAVPLQLWASVLDTVPRLEPKSTRLDLVAGVLAALDDYPGRDPEVTWRLRKLVCYLDSSRANSPSAPAAADSAMPDSLDTSRLLMLIKESQAAEVLWRTGESGNRTFVRALAAADSQMRENLDLQTGAVQPSN